MTLVNSYLLFDFNSKSDTVQWMVVDDGVMGGRSSGNFSINEKGNGEFYGLVSLENNGGFSSIRHLLEVVSTEPYSSFKIRLKGDGKNYQFRVKSARNDYFSYIHTFQTSGEWEVVEIKFAEMYPSFRGRRLNQPNFPGKQLEEIGFLIGNKQAESFKLELDKIELH